MSWFRTYELIEHTPSFFINEPSLFPFCPSSADFALDLLSPPFFNDIDPISDLIQIEKTITTRRLKLAPELYLQTLNDRVSALELGFNRLTKPTKPTKPPQRKYTWTTEIKSPEENGLDRKYKWVAEIKDASKKDNNYKFTAEIKGKGDKSPISKTYKFEYETINPSDKKVATKKTTKKPQSTRLVEITDSTPDRGAIVLKQAMTKRVEKIRGKKKELSPQDAAGLIQMRFRAYLIRRSQALRGLRELAIAKTKLKELRVLFNNFTYRRRVARDAEERQRFTEKIIVLLLTVDAIEGADLMVRSAKKSMVDELEAMLDVVDPQPGGRSISTRRTFDMPDAVIQKELAAGVSQIVQMLEEDASTSEEV